MSVLVGKKAPGFCAAAVTGSGEIVQKFDLETALKGKYGVILFYPLDFTFVCPSELIALDHRLAEFQKRNVEVMAVSVDSAFSHLAWRNTPVEKGGIGPVRYTLVADVSHQICQTYGVEHPEASVALRATFIIDKQGIIRSQIVNDLPIGRNIDEFIRLIDAVQFNEAHGEVCPANWQKGKATIKATS
jgi:peroxiredoxin (alkyl hydroperoxide reductase subunit C)